MQLLKKVLPDASLFVYLLLTILCMAFIQSLGSPFNVFHETNYHLQPYDLKGFLKGGIYIGVYLFCVVAIFLAIHASSRLLALILLVWISFSYGVDLLIQLIGNNSMGLSISIFSMGMAEKSRVLDLLMYKTQLFQAVIVAYLFFVWAVISRRYFFKAFRVNNYLSVAMVILATFLSFGAVHKVFSIVDQSFPAPIKLLSISSHYYLLQEKKTPRVLSTDIAPESSSEYETIVWIIDESISAQYLSVNGFHKETTPYLNQLKKNSPDFVNLGIVPSISNCSSSTNLMLRIGLTNKMSTNFRKNLDDLPTIFQYAKRAGYETHLMDAQAAKGQLQNHLTVSDKKDIDQFYTLNRLFKPKNRDRQIRKKLTQVLNSSEDKKRFIVVVKWGSHWPYALTYEEEVFKPAAKHSYTEMNEDNKEAIFNAYFNSLKYSVDDFLQELLSENRLDNKIIFYTADHGQMLYVHDNPLTHCHEWQTDMKDLPMNEYKVPFFIFSKNIKNTFDRPQEKVSTQEQLFSSTLELMGYGKSITSQYGPTLAQGEDPQNVKVNIMMTGRVISYRPE